MKNAGPSMAERLTAALASVKRLVEVMEQCPPEDDTGPHWADWERALEEARMVLKREESN